MDDVELFPVSSCAHGYPSSVRTDVSSQAGGVVGEVQPKIPPLIGLYTRGVWAHMRLVRPQVGIWK